MRSRTSAYRRVRHFWRTTRRASAEQRQTSAPQEAQRKGEAGEGGNLNRATPARAHTATAKQGPVLLIEDGPLCFVFEITKDEIVDGHRRLTSIPVEDTIRPVPLKFDPPLRSDGTNAKGFNYHWEQLTYLFDLPDPSTFISVVKALAEEDARLLIRFVNTCRSLAGYSIINSDAAFGMSSKGKSKGWTVRADLPSHEEFSGFSATFRQLHNDGEAASFVKAANIVGAALGELGLDEDELASSRAVLKSWRKARASLTKKAAATLICEKLNPNLKDEHPRTLKGIVPEDLIQNFNYGDTLHWGNKRQELADLTADPFDADFYKFCCSTTMVSISHLYFGFAVLVAAALGVPDLE
ncbi:hypothetical protein MTX80_23455 (plasmid) [Gordonia amicalis]|nr:hypothetical protein [Gordonia amicalis]UOG23758.1 hypothetical protein MTX80_23455 [Gordonia amicalis]